MDIHKQKEEKENHITKIYNIKHDFKKASDYNFHVFLQQLDIDLLMIKEKINLS